MLHSEPVPAPCRWVPRRKWEDEREEDRQMAGEAQFILHFLNVYWVPGLDQVLGIQIQQHNAPFRRIPRAVPEQGNF